MEKKQIERVVLSNEVAVKLDRWIATITSSRQGVDLSRRDLIQWLVMSKSDNLSPHEIKELADAHYDDVKFLHFAMRELKQARANGKQVDLQEFLVNFKMTKSTVKNKNQSNKLDPQKVEEESHE